MHKFWTCTYIFYTSHLSFRVQHASSRSLRAVIWRSSNPAADGWSRCSSTRPIALSCSPVLSSTHSGCSFFRAVASVLFPTPGAPISRTIPGPMPVSSTQPFPLRMMLFIRWAQSLAWGSCSDHMTTTHSSVGGRHARMLIPDSWANDSTAARM